MMAVHLAELEKEANRLLDLLIEFRAWARQGEAELAEKRLADTPLLQVQLEPDESEEAQETV